MNELYECDAGEPVVDGVVGLVVAQRTGHDLGFGDVGQWIGDFCYGPLERRR